MKNILKSKWVVIILVLIFGIVIGKFMGGKNSSDVNSEALHEHSEEQSLIWTCSMHPQIQKEKPGQCPLCGMDLIPLDNSMGGDEALPNEVSMSKSAMKLADIQTFIVKLEMPEKEIRLLGKVKADERLIYNQVAHFPGRIEKLYINFTGEKVYKGQKLASMYSPELITAQKELFEVLKDENTHPSLVEAARSKFKQWKFTDSQISDIEKSGVVQTDIDILSDQNGYVMMRMVAEGDHVKSGDVLFEITDLSKVWILFEAYENDLPWIKLGDELTIELKSIPGTIYNGKVVFIDPFINPKTRVAYVRVELPNARGLFKPDMFANGIISSKLPIKEEVILVPKSAVLWTGKRGVVYVKIPNVEHNSFIYRDVILGEDAGEFYVIREGLEEGDEIAINGVFKIDAAAQLAGKKSMMNPDSGKAFVGDHAGMDMGDETKADVVDDSKMNIEGEKMQNDGGHANMNDRITSSEIFKEQLENVFNAYIKLKDALVNDDSKQASVLAKELVKKMKKVDMKQLTNHDAHNHWMTISNEILESANSISEISDIEEQRSHFKHLSAHLSKGVKLFGVNQIVYELFCPMADNKNGAYWLSTEKKISNPYFGSSMIGCGEVIEEIKK